VDARAVVALVGGYDGSGNFGDVLLAVAALQLVRAQVEDACPLLVVEATRAEHHSRLAAEVAQLADAHVVCAADPGGPEQGPEIRLPDRLDSVLVYLYGGGYLNPRWGSRKLAMVEAVERLAARVGVGVGASVASGLQVAPGFVEQLEPEQRAILARLDPAAARDDVSRAALGELGLDPLDNGDDAVAVLPDGPEVDPGRRSAINVHATGHPWATQPDVDMALHFADVLAALAARSQSPLHVQPVLAYEDPFTSDRSDAERLVGLMGERGIECGEPELLHPGRPAEAAQVLANGALTLSGSYHVALCSSLAGTPAALARGNDYYRQKADGLARDLELPDALELHLDDAPAEAAERLAPVLYDRALRDHLRLRGHALRARRLRVEQALSRGLRRPLSRAADERARELRARALRLEERMRWYERQLVEAADAARVARERIADLERRLEGR
jgi:polysaccharide pyruvyl transferase WcaK-like protein